MKFRIFFKSLLTFFIIYSSRVISHVYLLMKNYATTSQLESSDLNLVLLKSFKSLEPMIYIAPIVVIGMLWFDELKYIVKKIKEKLICQ